VFCTPIKKAAQPAKVAPLVRCGELWQLGCLDHRQRHVDIARRVAFGVSLWVFDQGFDVTCTGHADFQFHGDGDVGTALVPSGPIPTGALEFWCLQGMVIFSVWPATNFIAPKASGITNVNKLLRVTA
jgi:hypothetical protein